MDTSDVEHLRRQQRAYFLKGATLSADFRLDQIEKLCQAVKTRESAIFSALRKDLSKPIFEAYGGEIGVFFEELKLVRRKLRKWMRPKRVATPVAHFLASSRLYPEPLGSVLVIAPWNYPVNLVLSPLLGSIAAGNCTVLKPSELAPATAETMAELVASTFEPEYVSCFLGGPETTQRLLAHPWDHIFFTGSTAIGKIVMEAAAKHLSPVTLELGGKSPCLIDDTVPMKQTARRIAWGKFFNAGQTCVAPDYVLLPKGSKAAFCTAVKEVVQEFFGDEPKESPDYARIINDRHFSRLVKLLEGTTPVMGGEHDAATRYIAPTLVDSVDWNSACMQEEIFGPILPLIEYDSLEEAVALIQAQPKPLSFYFFSKNSLRQRDLLKRVSFGGGCLNDTIMHLANPHLPFGGIGNSGMGRYHGRFSFEAFSHYKGVLNKSFLVDIPLRYPPYKKKDGIIRRLFSA